MIKVCAELRVTRQGSAHQLNSRRERETRGGGLPSPARFGEVTKFSLTARHAADV